jgi:uncharacterized protein (TIGR02996 family)
VTTEDDFRRAIEANPDDWDTLAVFSDWLRDRDDPRADGYAALARHGKTHCCRHSRGRAKKSGTASGSPG